MTTTTTAAELLAHAATAERNAAAQEAEAAVMLTVADGERTRLASALADRKRAHRKATRRDRPNRHAAGRAELRHIDENVIPPIEKAIAAAQADVDHLTADAARLRAVAADYRAQAAALTATPVTVTAPEAFIDWYADYGTSKITDADADATLTAARTAYRTAPAGERVKITTSDPRILDGLITAATAFVANTRECMDADPDSAGLLARDIRRTEHFAERVTAARAELLAQPAQEAPSAPQTAPEEGRTLVGRWESDGGKYWVELYRDQWGYGYDGKGCGGYLGKITEAEALRWIEERTAGGAAFFHPGKRPMSRVTPAHQPA